MEGKDLVVNTSYRSVHRRTESVSLGNDSRFSRSSSDSDDIVYVYPLDVPLVRAHSTTVLQMLQSESRSPVLYSPKTTPVHSTRPGRGLN
jgi:hypothetical protein